MLPSGQFAGFCRSRVSNSVGIGVCWVRTRFGTNDTRAGSDTPAVGQGRPEIGRDQPKLGRTGRTALVSSPTHIELSPDQLAVAERRSKPSWSETKFELPPASADTAAIWPKPAPTKLARCGTLFLEFNQCCPDLGKFGLIRGDVDQTMSAKHVPIMSETCQS